MNNVFAGMRTAVGCIRAVLDEDSDALDMLAEGAVEDGENVGLGAVLLCVWLIDVLAQELDTDRDSILAELALFVQQQVA